MHTLCRFFWHASTLAQAFSCMYGIVSHVCVQNDSKVSVRRRKSSDVLFKRPASVGERITTVHTSAILSLCSACVAKSSSSSFRMGIGLALYERWKHVSDTLHNTEQERSYDVVACERFAGTWEKIPCSLWFLFGRMFLWQLCLGTGLRTFWDFSVPFAWRTSIVLKHAY